MNKYKQYHIQNISLDDINHLEKEYLSQASNSNLKKVEIAIKNNDLLINIEPYIIASSKWNELICLLKKKKVKFWFRDDDVGIDNDNLVELLQYFENQKLRIFLAVIPKLCDNNLRIKLSTFNNFSLGQHGYAHVNYSKNELAEYTVERNQKQVEEELIEGDKILLEFGNKYLKVFVPPWFEIDTNTKKNLKKLNYKIMSNYWDNKRNSDGLTEVNCQVDFVNWDAAYTFGGEDFVLSQIIEQLNKVNEGGYIGLLLHHERIGKETYAFLDKLIEILKKYSFITDIENIITCINEEAND